MYSKDSGKDQMLMTMERELTSGQKAGFFFLGFLGGIAGILAASLMNINAPYRPEGTKMAALGFATGFLARRRKREHSRWGVLRTDRRNFLTGSENAGSGL